MRKIILLLSLIIGLEVSAYERIELILNPQRSDVTSEISLLRQCPEVKGLTPVFLESEAKALRGLGQTALSQSHKFYVESEKDLEKVKTYIKIKSLPFVIDRNSMPIKMSEPFESEQWGLKNNGGTQTLFLDRYRSLKIAGKSGEDIGKAKKLLPRTGKKVVAILDSGVDTSHPDLTANIMRKPKECEALQSYKKCLRDATGKADLTKKCHDTWANYDSDGNGYPMDCEGWNLLDKNNFPNDMMGSTTMRDNSGHGSHVAGIIAASENNIGIKGCTDNALILPIRVIDEGPRAPVQPQEVKLQSPKETDLKKDLGMDISFGDIIARGLLYAIRSKVDVINMSLGWPGQVDTELIRKMVALAQSQGIVVVAAAGNDSTDALIMPCVYPGVICVTAHSNDGSLSHFSNYGSGVDIAAPGLNILSTIPKDIEPEIFTDLSGYDFKNGSSMATPFGSCAAVDLLSQGMSSSELYARLMLGARPHQQSLVRNFKMVTKYTLSGNLDIDRSLSVSPQPFIMLTKKEPVELSWDGSSRQIPFSFGLNNFWQNAGNVNIKLNLINSPTSNLTVREYNFNGWKQNEVKFLNSELLTMTNGQDFPSELLFEVVVTSGVTVRRIPMQGTVTVTVSPQINGLDAKHIPIKDFKLDKNMSLKSVTSVLKRGEQDYLITENLPEKKTRLKLLSVKDGVYQVNAQIEMDTVSTDLVQVQKIDFNLDGSDDYVVIYNVEDPEKKKRPYYVFVFLDKNLQPIGIPFKSGLSARMKYESDYTGMPGDFQWIRQGQILLPAWVGVGLTPDDKKPDPWGYKKSDSPQLRLYYIDLNGLQVISKSDGFVPTLNISQSPEQATKGIMPVLLSKGDGYNVDYAMAMFSNGKLENQKPLSLGKFRNIIGEANRGIISLDNKSTGSSYVTSLGSGKMRTTWFGSNGEFLDQELNPLNNTDAVDWISGAYWGNGISSVFAQTHSELQYHDFASGQVKVTSLNRYSYMPVVEFSRIFFPVTVNSNGLNKKVPGLYVPAGLGTSKSSIVMVPKYTATGELLSVDRPAQMRLIAGKGCERIGDPVNSEERKSMELVFYCENEFIRVPLKF